MSVRYGALPEEWAHLDLALGLTADLLPVVSNPHAPISPRSKMKATGKTPSVYNRNRQVAGIPDWTAFQAGDRDIDRWVKEQDYGICIQTRNIRAIDIDVNEYSTVERILSYISHWFGNNLPPIRKRSSCAKCLVGFRLPGEMPKRILRLSSGIIEFLATGQQFVAHGTHPSGARYEWEWNGQADFPTLTLEQFEELWEALVKEFAGSVSDTAASVMRNRADTPALNIEDPLLDTLPVIAWGREGQAFIECPFKGEHTMDSGVTETTYFPAGSRGYEQGHFHCLHAHCADKNDADFLDALGLRFGMFDVIEEMKEHAVFNIKLKGGDLPKIVVEAEDALISASMPYYQRGSSIVRPVVDTLQATKGRKTHIVQLYDIDAPYLVRDLCKVATWLRFDGRSRKWSKIDAPIGVAITLLRDYGNWRFPKVTGVISTPTLRPDGSLLHMEGYDEKTGLLLVGMPPMPEISMEPNKLEAMAALDTLKDLLLEFPFVGEEDRSVALSTLITPVVRGAFAVAPMHVVRAPSPGSGKSFLLDIASAIATGQPCPVMAAGRNEEETEKRLGAALMAGQPIISIDNVNGSLGGDFLCQLVERPVVEVRILGKSQMVKIESRSTIFATGNNIKLVGDMVRRALLCMMDANRERPELRQFRDNPVARVLAERGKYIAAALTIVRAYIVAGRPDKAANIASFTEWSDTVRSALMWLGEVDPVKTMETVREEDPYLQSMTTIFHSIKDCLGINEPMTAAEILKLAQQGNGVVDDETTSKFEAFYEAIVNAVGNITGRVTSKQFGRWLGNYKGRIAGGLRLEGKIDKHGHAALWWVSEETLV